MKIASAELLYLDQTGI